RSKKKICAGDGFYKPVVSTKKGSAPNHKKPFLMDEIKKMVEEFPSTLIGQRDRALLLVGFAGAFRRSELVALNLEDIDFNKGGLIVTMRRSKTDQKGEGYKKGIPYGSNVSTCPVRALQNWLEQSKINSGALFRSINKSGVLQESRLSDRDVARILKRAAYRAGLNPDGLLRTLLEIWLCYPGRHQPGAL
ncbi:MAG TPA: site-specific integrase, partial [bacterium]